MSSRTRASPCPAHPACLPLARDWTGSHPRVQPADQCRGEEKGFPQLPAPRGHCCPMPGEHLMHQTSRHLLCVCPVVRQPIHTQALNADCAAGWLQVVAVVSALLGAFSEQCEEASVPLPFAALGHPQPVSGSAGTPRAALGRSAGALAAAAGPAGLWINPLLGLRVPSPLRSRAGHLCCTAGLRLAELLPPPPLHRETFSCLPCQGGEGVQRPLVAVAFCSGGWSRPHRAGTSKTTHLPPLCEQQAPPCTALHADTAVL